MAHARKAVMTTAKITDQVILDALMALPQSCHFKPENIQRFLDARRDDPRVMWHVKRLSGIGGSEIGVLVAAQRGVPDAFGNTPADIIGEKLLAFEPKKTTIAMRKGIVAETCLRQFFLEDYKAERDMKSIGLLESDSVKMPFEWMRYSPDDIVKINGHRYLVDYKHPKEASLHDDLHLRYICQLHQGQMILDYNGIKIDGMLLVQYPEHGDDLLVSEIPFDDSIVDDIIKSGQSAWFSVLSGHIPLFQKKADAISSLPQDKVEALNDLSGEFVRTKALADALYADAKKIQERITGIVNQCDIADGSQLVATGLKIGVKVGFDVEVAAQALGDAAMRCKLPVYSADAMSKYLREMQPAVNMAQFETGATIWDESAIKSMLKDHGMSENQFMSQALRMTLNCSKEYKESARDTVISVRNDFPVVEAPSPKIKLSRKGA
jgi:hypothetical protein